MRSLHFARKHTPGTVRSTLTHRSHSSPILPAGSGSGAGDAASATSLAASLAAGIAAAEAELRAEIAELRAKITAMFGHGRRGPGDEITQFILQLGDTGERVEVRQEARGQLVIGKNQLELLLIRAPDDHALRSKYLRVSAAQWKPTPQPTLLGGGWTSLHADWPADLRVVERRTFIVPA